MYPCDMKVSINGQEYSFNCLESVYQSSKHTNNNVLLNY